MAVSLASLEHHKLIDEAKKQVLAQCRNGDRLLKERAVAQTVKFHAKDAAHIHLHEALAHCKARFKVATAFSTESISPDVIVLFMSTVHVRSDRLFCGCRC